MNKANEWNNQNWTRIGYIVNSLQCEIFEASKEGRIGWVYELQNSLIGNNEAKLLAIWRVTQENLGKRTAGVDGVKKLNAKQRMNLAKTISIDGKTSAIRWIWISKPGKKEKRPLGIPTIKDRVKQAIVKLALEPQWEAQFEGTSYGFRPGRSTMHAVIWLWGTLWNSEKFILDADIRKCFDRIDHEKLLKKINTSPTLTHQIKAWLKAGILDPDISPSPQTNEKGTPQGGIISPLLCNIALHGMHEYVLSRNPNLGRRKLFEKQSLAFVRYADDFVFIHPSREIIEQTKGYVSEFLAEIGLELNEEKTVIRNSMNEINYNNKKIGAGLEFLGFYFHLVESQASKNKKAAKNQGRGAKEKSYLNLRTMPANSNYLSHMNDLRMAIKRSRGVSQAKLIGLLTPMIQGWTNYYKYVRNKFVFNNCDTQLFNLLKNWVYRRHGNMQWYEALKKYFMQHKQVKWTFACFEHGYYYWVLPFHRHRKTEDFMKIMIKDSYSPYNRETANKIGNFKLNKTIKSLFNRQNGVCKWCLHKFHPDDILEIHHTLKKTHPKREYTQFKWLVHLHCHDELHKSEFFELDFLAELKANRN